ncbi:acyl-CoA dehydrogenase [Constrictibacter sp. MBR-5]|jgi:alkylation response protein AidB-like acyl-CoA dehydrogenase|uniref:acyl-CoA dehydrogenase family protein n=1 Tax=Constrictibacter sp. MBR-5 TaxID=3156467 RepID=UPI00339B15B8
MNDSDNLIVDTATKLLQDLSTPSIINDAEAGKWPGGLWDALEESGLTLTWVSDELGGAGAEVSDGFAVLKVAGLFTAPVPLAETLLAGWLLGQAGMNVPAGPMTAGPVYADASIDLNGGKLTGSARHLPFARSAKHIALIVRDGGTPKVALVAAADCAIAHGVSLAGEPRDDVSFDGVTPLKVSPAPAGLDETRLAMVGAAMRSVQMAGALQKILDQSVQYATERVQFGRPIGKFQAIQHSLAELAGEVAAAGAAADAAAEAVARGAFDDADVADIATAKIRVGEAASTGSAIAHQVHGAMGFTYEHSLHHATRRLWAWRDEFGNEAQWSIRLGHLVAKRGADDLWPFITGA